MTRIIVIIALAIGLPAATCNPTPPAPTPIPTPASEGDAGTSDYVYEQACASLHRAECDEGSDPHCASALKNGAAITPVPIKCLTAAWTKSQVRACGPFVKCP